MIILYNKCALHTYYKLFNTNEWPYLVDPIKMDL